MATFTIDAPNGKSYTIEGDNAQGALAALQKHLGGNDSGSSGGFSDRLQKVWDNPTPGGLLWIAKQAYEGVKGSVEGSEAAVAPQVGSDEEEQIRQRAEQQGPGRAAQVASMVVPGAPGGTGGLFAAPMKAVPEVVRNLPAVASPTVQQLARQTSQPEVSPLLAAAMRLSDVTGSDITVPRAIASDSATAQRIGQGLRNIPIVGDRIPQATGRLVENLNQATQNVADQFGSGSGPNVASRVGQSLTDAAAAEAQAAEEAAARSNEAVRAAHQRATDQANQSIAGREVAARDVAQRAVGDMSPQDMGTALIQRLRTDEGAARATKDALYDEAGRADASVRLDEVQNARPYVVQGLEEAGVVIDPLLTPAANRMLDEVQRIAQSNIPNRAQIARPAAPGDERGGVTVQGIEQARKRLVSLQGAAGNDSDRRAARMVMRRFDDWQSHAFENALLSGDDRALNAFRQARAANAQWRDRFFSDEEDADNFVNRIVTGEVTPQEVANYLIGAGQVGAKGVSSRLLDRIGEITNHDPEVNRSIGGAMWNKLTQTTEGTAPKDPQRVARDIMEFLNGSGRDVAQRQFTPAQQRLMRAYAETLRRGQEARQLIAQVSETTRPDAMTAQAGPLKQLADAVVGKGAKSDEALFRAIDGYAKSGGRADVATLAKLVQAIPQEDKTDLAGAIIRNIGISPKTGQFSPDVFVSQWNTYTPQAKAILFGNAGAQRKALDDIAMISARLKDVGSKFGNPSGTAQNVGFTVLGASLAKAGASLMHGDVLTPLAMLATGIGGYGAARVLAAPAGASSVAKWAKAYSDLVLQRSPKALGVFRLASRNLASTAESLGVKANPNDFLKALQGPQQAGAQDEKK